MTALGICPACWGQVRIGGDGRVGVHNEQVVTAQGFADGGTQCAGAGEEPYLSDVERDQRHLAAVTAERHPPMPKNPSQLTVAEREERLLHNVASYVVRLGPSGVVKVWNGRSTWVANPRILNRLLDQGLIAMGPDGRYRLTPAGHARPAPAADTRGRAAA